MPGCSRHRSDRKVSSGVNLTASPQPRPVFKRVYEYSLIPGGVEDAATFRMLRASDKVLLQHFRNIGDQLVSTTLKHDKWMYTSYRVGNSIYWTKNRVLVPAGEPLLTDGKAQVRSRCGNRLSDSPHRPVQAFQPPAVTTNRFAVEVAMAMPPMLTPEVEAPFIPGSPEVAPPVPVESFYAPGSPLESGGEILPIPVPLPPDSSGEILLPTPLPTPITVPGTARKPTVVPLIPTPEPGTRILTLVGICCLAGMSLQKLPTRPSYCC